MRHGFSRPRSARVLLRAAAAAALAITVLTSSACESDYLAAEDNSIDLSKLDTGSFATKPTPITTTDAAETGRLAEALRLGNTMPLPTEIDPALSHNYIGIHPIANTSDLLEGHQIALGWLAGTAFATNPTGFTAGFVTSARTDDDRDLGYGLTEVVMSFDSDGDAAAAATAYAANGFVDDGTGAGEPARSSSHPTALLSWLPQFQHLVAFYPTGKFLTLVLVDDAENNSLKISDLPDLIGKSDKAIDATVDRLKSFRPTPPDQLGALPLDPQGMLRLSLPRPAGDQTEYAFEGTLDARGALQNETEATPARAAFDRDGVDAVSYRAGVLYRTRDSAAAKDLLDTYFLDRFHRRIDSPSGLPNARCVKYHGPDTRTFPFVCSVTYGRYAAQVWSQQQQDAFQRISAQFAILANDK